MPEPAQSSRPATAGFSRVTFALLAALVLLSLAFRLPPLVNAATVDSDAAIVGLQARHILAGEWSWFLYGSGYQTSVDSCVAALFFALLGPSPLSLLLSTLIGHVVLTCLAFGTLARRLPLPAAFVLVLPLVFTSSPLHTYILNPPRQASLTLVFLAVFVLDGATLRAGATAATPGRLLQSLLGALLASLACFADPYALLLLPAVALLAILGVFDPPRGTSRQIALQTAALFVGALVGIVPLMLLLASPHSVHGETTLTSAVIPHNFALLAEPCLPWLVGATAYVPKALLGYVPWEPGAFVHTVQRGGALLFLAAVATGGLLVRRADLPWPVRRFGLFGFVAALLTVGSFLLSVMVMDLFSSRYLAAVVLTSPFALAPLAFWLGWRRLTLLLAPYLVGAGLSGWVGYGDEVAGMGVVSLAGHGARDELTLLSMLEQRGIRVAIADYWVSYRLTFLSDEGVAVVPIHAREDRYPPYRRAYAEATRTAYVFDPKRSREDLAAMEAEAFTGGSRWGTPVERFEVGGLTAVVFDKVPTETPDR